MGTLTCNRCGATADGSSQEEADERIDHARGYMIGRPCSGYDKDLVWNSSGKTEETPRRETVVVESESPQKETKKKSKRR